MAEKRFLSRRITESDKMRALVNDGRLLATTLYQMLLPYTDREGRLNANSYYLMGGIFQGYTFTLEELTEAINDLARVGLVHLYRNGRHDRVIQYAKFTIKQGGFNKPHEREAASSLPGPTDAGSEIIIRPGNGRTRINTPPESNPDQVRDEVPDKVTDKDETRAETESGQSPDELKIELELKTEIEEEHSSISTIDNPPPKSLAASPPRTSHDPGLFIETWNANRGRLPAVQALNSKRRGAIRSLVKEYGPTGALDLFRDATLAVAHDEFWLTRQYGFDNLLSGGKVLARAEQWRAGAHQLGEGNLRLAANVERWAKALPTQSEPPEGSVN